MPIKARALGNIYSCDIESDIAELSYSWPRGLIIVVDTGRDRFTPLFLEITFRSVGSFRCLDEGDLIRYWESREFDQRYHLYEIIDGGWVSGETLDSGLLSVSSSVGLKEWLVVTTNQCVTVLGGSGPLLREFADNSNQRVDVK